MVSRVKATQKQVDDIAEYLMLCCDERSEWTAQYRARRIVEMLGMELPVQPYASPPFHEVCYVVTCK